MASDFETIQLESSDIPDTSRTRIWVPAEGDADTRRMFLFKQVRHLAGGNIDYTEEQFLAEAGAALDMFLSAGPAVAAAIPRTELLWRPVPDDPKRYAGFLVTARVVGTEARQVAHLDERHAHELDELMAGLIAVARDQQTSNGTIKMPDLATMKGHVKNLRLGRSLWRHGDDDRQSQLHFFFYDLLPTLVDELYDRTIWWRVVTFLWWQSGGTYTYPKFRTALDDLLGPDMSGRPWPTL